MASVNTFTTDSFKSATVDNKEEQVLINYKLNCASYKVYECNLVFVGLCTQDEDIAISW